MSWDSCNYKWEPVERNRTGCRFILSHSRWKHPTGVGNCPTLRVSRRRSIRRANRRPNPPGYWSVVACGPPDPLSVSRATHFSHPLHKNEVKSTAWGVVNKWMLYTNCCLNKFCLLRIFNCCDWDYKALKLWLATSEYDFKFVCLDMEGFD